MTEAKTGAISVVDGNGVLVGFFTDGDIRRALKDKGKATLDLKVGDLLNGNAPITVSVDALLYDAVNLFKQKNLDNLAVVQADKPVGILDIQDLVKLGLVG
jgi:CBS domain-containing protein